MLLLPAAYAGGDGDCEENDQSLDEGLLGQTGPVEQEEVGEHGEPERTDQARPTDPLPPVMRTPPASTAVSASKS